MKKYIKKMSFVLIVAMIFSLISPIKNIKTYAMDNTDYYDLVSNSSIADQNGDDEASEPGTLLGLVMIAVLQVGKLVENLVTWLMGLFGTAVFPWADYIIFNCIPILDVNFINPTTNSLFGSGFSGGNIGNIFRNIYFTGLSIAVGFLGIIVAVMAIKMAISTIASEKARYKESIVTLLTTLILLFGTHYLLSFTFYLNEKLVEVASNIVQNIETKDTKVDGTSKTAVEIVSGMGQYFYDKALADGGKTSVLKVQKAAPIPTVLYLMFIVQSLMFLFAYFKRLFYVAILSVMAPIVVIYDFLRKAISM